MGTSRASEGVAAWKSRLGHPLPLCGLEVLMLSTPRCGTVSGITSFFPVLSLFVDGNVL